MRCLCLMPSGLLLELSVSGMAKSRLSEAAKKRLRAGGCCKRVKGLGGGGLGRGCGSPDRVHVDGVA